MRIGVAGRRSPGLGSLDLFRGSDDRVRFGADEDVGRVSRKPQGLQAVRIRNPDPFAVRDSCHEKVATQRNQTGDQERSTDHRFSPFMERIESGGGKTTAGSRMVEVLFRETFQVAPPISSLIASAEGGDRSAADALFGALYAELHQLARRQLARGPGATLGTTTLLHEAYLEHLRPRGHALPRPRALHGLRGQGHARPDHRLRAEPAGPEARRRIRDHRHRRRRRPAGGRRGGARAHRRGARRARRGRTPLWPSSST